MYYYICLKNHNYTIELEFIRVLKKNVQQIEVNR